MKCVEMRTIKLLLAAATDKQDFDKQLSPLDVQI